MNSSRMETIRYHTEFYSTHKLFQEGSWLAKPDQAILDLVPLFHGKEEIKILDLGSGVGRNAIPLAQALPSSNITCVDVIDIAIEELKRNSKEFHVSKNIRAIQSSVEEFDIASNSYDLIIASSVIEHAVKRSEFDRLVHDIKNGTKIGGINRYSITVDLCETNLETQASIEPLIETALSTEEVSRFFNEVYYDWKILAAGSTPYEEVEIRDGAKILWKCSYFSFIAQRPLE